MTHAAIYLRQSQDRDGNELGVSRQREDCIRLCAGKGWETTEYKDNDTSASSGRPRKGYRRMLAEIRAGRVDAIVAWDLDRLYRRPVELEELIDLADEQKLMLATVTGDVDLATDNGRLYARIKGAVSRAEVERKSARSRREGLQRAQRGVPAWPRPPFGFTTDTGGTIVLDPVQAELIRDSYAALIAGASLGSVARTWNAAGALSTFGNPWTANTVRGVLHKARNAGLREYRGDIIGPGAWPAVVSEEVWRSARAVLDAPGRQFGGLDRGRKHLLSGVALCGVCNGPIGVLPRTRPNGTTYTRYFCRQHGHVARHQDLVDDLVVGVVCARLARDDARDLLIDRDRGDMTTLRDEANALRTRMQAIAVEFADDDTMTPAQFRLMNQRMTERLAGIESRMVDADRAHVFDGLPLASDTVRKHFDALDLDRRRAIIDTLIKVVILTTVRGQKTGSFDPERVHITWKGAA